LDPAIGKSAGKWTPEEDAKLTEAINKHGTDWVAIAALVHGRTNRQVRQRWTNRTNPAIRKKVGRWTPEEDRKLIKAVKKHGNKWVAVAALVHGRTSDQCCGRWTRSLDPDRTSNTAGNDKALDSVLV
jgi:hypothetical protein